MYADYPNIALILCAAALGIMLFFSALVAPGIFKHLPIEWAAVYVRQFFPKYYAFLRSRQSWPVCSWWTASC